MLSCFYSLIDTQVTRTVEREEEKAKITTWVESQIRELEVSKKMVIKREVMQTVKARIQHMEVEDKKLSVDQLQDYVNEKSETRKGNSYEFKILDAKTHREYFELNKRHLHVYGPNKPFTETAAAFDRKLKLAQDLARNHLQAILVDFPPVWEDKDGNYFLVPNEQEQNEKKKRVPVEIYCLDALQWCLEINNGRVLEAFTALYDSLNSPLLKEGISGLPRDSTRMRQIRRCHAIFIPFSYHFHTSLPSLPLPIFIVLLYICYVNRYNDANFEPQPEDFEILKSLSEADKIRFKDYVPQPVRFPKPTHIQRAAFELDVFVNPVLDVMAAIREFNNECKQFYAFRDTAESHFEKFVRPKRPPTPDDVKLCPPVIMNYVPESIATKRIPDQKVHRNPVQSMPVISKFIEPDTIKWVWNMWCSLAKGGRECADYVQELKLMSIHYILGAQSLRFPNFAGELNLVRDPEQPALKNMRAKISASEGVPVRLDTY